MTGIISAFVGGSYGLPTITLTLSATTTNYNLFTAAGSPTEAKNVILNINSGVTVGGTGSSTALTVGQFPTGSTITINNSGNIDGFGGAAGTSGVGGNGGDAINANYANQTVVINNNSGANKVSVELLELGKTCGLVNVTFDDPLFIGYGLRGAAINIHPQCANIGNVFMCAIVKRAELGTAKKHIKLVAY